MTTATRQSPIAHACKHLSKDVEATLTHLPDLVSIGLKGPALASWAQQNTIEIPATLYDVNPVSDTVSLMRVGSNELIIEALQSDPLLIRIEQSLHRLPPGLYRVEQQAAIFDLHGPLAHRILAQTCGVDPTTQAPNKIFFTRIAGVSCGVIVQDTAQGRVLRIRVDYSFAYYLWETLVEIIAETIAILR